MTDEEKRIIKREILLAYIKISNIKKYDKPSVKLSIAIEIGLNEAERKIKNKKE
jgi:hypothetical protein